MDDALRVAYAAADGDDPHVELVHLRAARAAFESVVPQAFYDALVVEGDHLVVVWSGLHQDVLVVRADVVMAATTDRAPTAQREPPHFDDQDGGASAHLPDAEDFRAPGTRP